MHAWTFRADPWKGQKKSWTPWRSPSQRSSFPLAVASLTDCMLCLYLLPTKRKPGKGKQEVLTFLIEQIEDARSQELMASLSSVPPGLFEAPAMLGKGRGLGLAEGFSSPLSPNSCLGGAASVVGDGCPIMRPVSCLLLPLASLAPYQSCLGDIHSVASLWSSLGRILEKGHLWAIAVTLFIYFQLWYFPSGTLVQ